jgi:anti-anti-sigma regulatory factor
MKTQIIRIPSDLAFHNVSRYIDEMKTVDVSGRVVVDFSGVSEVYSSLVRFLLDLKRLTGTAGGHMDIILSDPVRRAFFLLGMDKFFAAEIERGDRRVA